MDFPRTSGGHFNDISFPADQSSLYWAYAGKSGEDLEMQTTYQEVKSWKTPVELEGGAVPSLWGKLGVRPAAIQQGQLGDCWFLSAMAALAEWPDRVKKVFNNQDSYAADGMFQINFNSAGKLVKVTIDDRLPVYDASGTWRPINLSRSPNGAWWGPLLEKAAAKFYGRYENMNGGQEVESLYALTGMPTVNIVLATMSDSDLWNLLNSYDKLDYVMTSGVSGLVMNHAYTLIGTAQFNGEFLVKIRNPWGSERYEGPWSDDDKTKWTEEAKVALAHTVSKDDGEFYMSISNYKQLFTDVSIALYQNWNKASKQVTWDRTKPATTVSVSFNNPQKQRVVVGLTGLQSRMFRDSKCSNS
jgi:hypothetical protein